MPRAKKPRSKSVKDGRQILRRRRFGEKWALSENLVHSAKIISIIRAKIEDTLGGQSLGGLRLGNHR
jgi:hypothetical protein